VCLARELRPGTPIGRDFLGTRVVAWRDAAGQPVVQSAWCPHLGADLSVGQVVEGRLRCAYHHWSFDGGGACATSRPATGSPTAARIFAYPAASSGAWSGRSTASAPISRCRASRRRAETIEHQAQTRGERPWDTWIAVSNGVDFQHLRTLHGLPAARCRTNSRSIRAASSSGSRVPFHLQHGRITGTNTFAQHLRLGGRDMFQLFSGAPIAPGRSNGFFVVGVPRGEGARLPEVLAMVDQLSAEDAPVLSTMRFRRGLLTASDRHLARYFKYVEDFPTFLPPT
jgi:nitrite reductase/ring-hydroxylating ferredoxin subunit